MQYELTKNAQIWPRSQNAQLQVPDDKICLIFASMGGMENEGLQFIGKNFAYSSKFNFLTHMNADGFTFLQVRLHCLSFLSLSLYPAALLLRLRYDQQPGRLCHHPAHHGRDLAETN